MASSQGDDEAKWAHLQLMDESAKYKKMFVDMRKLEVLLPDLERKEAATRADFNEINEQKYAKRTNRTWEIAYSRWRSAYDSFNTKSNQLEAKRLQLMQMLEERISRRVQKSMAR